MADKDTCALWYWRHNTITYDVFDTEAEAASMAVYFKDDAQGVPIGVQFANGRTIRYQDWDAYRAARQQADEDCRQRLANPAEPRPTRTVLDPFEGKEVTIEADEPSWLGKTPAPA